MTLLIILLFTFAASLPLSEIVKQRECTKFHSAYYTFCTERIGPEPVTVHQGRPGKIGPIGGKGERGPRGVQGEKGEVGNVDYNVIEELLEIKLQKVREEHARNYTEMKLLLAEERKQIDILRRSDICPVNYEGKCFWIERKEQSFDKMNALCESRGGRIANIYSSDHYSMIFGYLRTNIGLNDYYEVAVGLTYRRDTGTAVLTDGTAAPFVKWHQGYPKSGSSKCMMLVAREPRDSLNQGLYQISCGARIKGVACERQYSH